MITEYYRLKLKHIPRFNIYPNSGNLICLRVYLPGILPTRYNQTALQVHQFQLIAPNTQLGEHDTLFVLKQI